MQLDGAAGPRFEFWGSKLNAHPVYSSPECQAALATIKAAILSHPQARPMVDGAALELIGLDRDEAHERLARNSQ